MANEPTLLIYDELNFNVGDETFLDSITENGNAVVFEDDGTTGYFYAVNSTDNSIMDALHVYDVSSIIDKHKSSKVKILWNNSQTRAFLTINDYYHAVFDFIYKSGYCRNGFPESYGSWSNNSDRKLTDDLFVRLAEK